MEFLELCPLCVLVTIGTDIVVLIENGGTLSTFGFLRNFENICSLVKFDSIGVIGSIENVHNISYLVAVCMSLL